VPRSVLGLHPVLTLAGLAMTRMAYRMLYEQMLVRLRASDGSLRRALVLGAGDAGRLLLAGIQHRGCGRRPHQAGPAHRACRCWAAGRRAALVCGAGCTHIIVALPSATPAERRRRWTRPRPPSRGGDGAQPRAELREGQPRANVRDVEPEDLLGREPVQLDEAGISECPGRQGGAGDRRGRLDRQRAVPPGGALRPARLVLFELSEFALYRIEQEFLSEPSRTCRWCAWHRRRARNGPPARLFARSEAAGRLPRRRLQARAADGGGQRLAGLRNNVLGTCTRRGAAAEAAPSASC
jgi:FlaA1/EpsC-like NDP-sugar epimerase